MGHMTIFLCSQQLPSSCSMQAEHHGGIIGYRAASLAAGAAFTPVAQMFIPVGHFHLLPAGKHPLSVNAMRSIDG